MPASMLKNINKPKTRFQSYALPFVLAMGAFLGALGYFLLPVEVSVPFFVLLSTVSLVGAWLLRGHHALFLGCALAASGLGYLAHTAFVVQDKNTTFLAEEYEQGRHWVVGQIAKSGTYDGRDKVTLEHVKIYGVAENKTPNKVRISSSEGRLSEFYVGDWVAVEAKLFAPKPQQHAGDFNLKRYYWLKGIGATGYVMGRVYKTSWPQGFYHSQYRVQKLREKLSSLIITTPKGEKVAESEAVLTALTIGKRTELSDALYSAYRRSGLAHLLAISGLHVGLVAGFVYFGFRRFICLFPHFAVRFNGKVPAAILAVLAAGGYTVLAGATLPTIRAFLMLSLLFLAVVLGRLHNTMRILMLTLALVLFIWPESVLTASFQMSFAAVFALTLYNEYKERELYSALKIVQGFGYVKGVFLTSIVAGVATMPVAAWHFGEVHFTGFLVNVLAIPLTAFVVMPFAFLGLLLTPFGLHTVAWQVAAWGVEWVNTLAYWGAEQLFGHAVVEPSEVLILSLFCLLLMACLYAKRFVKTSFVMLCASAWVLATFSFGHADILWLRGGQTQLVYKEGVGYLAAVSDGSVAEKQIFEDFAVVDTPLPSHLNCDDVGCVVENNGRTVLLAYPENAPQMEDCFKSDLVLTAHYKMAHCKHAFVPEEGAVSYKIYLSPTGVTLKPFKPKLNRVWD